MGGSAMGADRSGGRTVSIVIPVFNRAELTEQCITSLAAATTGDFEVIVVDNASTDDTPALLDALGGAVIAIRNAENQGFARACNTGARRANGDYVVFLNNDTIPHPGWLDALVAVIERDPEIGAVGARLLYPDGTIQHAGIAFSADFEPFHVYQGLPGKAPQVSVDRDCEAVTGACLLMPRALFLELGGFDEAYRMYFEDVDLCLRVRAAGRRVRYAAGSVVTHLERASSPSFNAAFALNRESRERFRARWLTPSRPAASARSGMRVLFQARPSLFDRPGGDTVVIDRLITALERRGVTVSFSSTPDVPAGTDLVHTINFANPELTQQFTQAAERRGVPVVVTTLYEDWSRFLRPCHVAAAYFKQALAQAGASDARGVDRRALRDLLARVRAATPPADRPNAYTASVARVLLACGESERRRLEEDFPSARVHVIPFGADHHGDDAAVEPDLFARTYGVRDYVLCVARLEPRKNQLMLLEALRDDPRPVVLVAGDFSYAPEYATMCRELRRRGPTVIVGRLDSTMLAAAFREAAVHCLPSWYELPGLVSVEAASYGTPVAASSWGTVRDYLGDTIAYLEPDDPESIARAVDAAVRTSADAAAARARAYTWERTAAEAIAVYEEVLGAAQVVPTFATPGVAADAANGAVTASSARPETVPPGDGVCAAALASVDAFLADAERARRGGDYACVLACAERAHALDRGNLVARELRATALAQLGRLDDAEEAFTALLETGARCRAAHALGVLALDRGHLAEASTWLTEATRDGAGADSWVALAMCHARSGDAPAAWDAFSAARDRDPSHRQALHGLITLAPELARLGDLERHLRHYLEAVGDDADVRCALASCLFAAGNVAESRTTVDAVLATAPDHPVATALATELRG